MKNFIICVSALDIMFSMLLNLLIANTTILLFFFLIVFKSFYRSSITNKKHLKPRLALVIPTSSPMIVANEVIEKLPIVADKTN